MNVYGLKTGVAVGDAMTANLVACSSRDTIKQAAKLMAKEKIGCLVVKDGSMVVGIITDTDIVRKAVTSDISTAKRSVGSIMTHKLISVNAADDIFDATRTMRDYNIKHLLVRSDGDIVGLVTIKDVLRIEPDLFEILVEKFELRETGRKPIRR